MFVGCWLWPITASYFIISYSCSAYDQVCTLPLPPTFALVLLIYCVFQEYGQETDLLNCVNTLEIHVHMYISTCQLSSCQWLPFFSMTYTHDLYVGQLLGDILQKLTEAIVQTQEFQQVAENMEQWVSSMQATLKQQEPVAARVRLIEPQMEGLKASICFTYMCLCL